jgi:4,5-DOPA dioxygenase extradiol
MMDNIKSLRENLKEKENCMPVLFIGHGSPMNGIEHNEFTEGWTGITNKIETPEAIIVVSAHWMTRGTRVTAMQAPPTIHDFGGFPKELYDVQYPAPGDPELATSLQGSIKSAPVALSHEWGLDHGAWTILRHMYPDAQVPVIQISLDYGKSAASHYELSKELSSLRKKGVLIVGSGNIVHNLRMVAWDHLHDNYAYDWAKSADHTFKKLIQERDHKKLMNYEALGTDVKYAVPTPEHYLPLLYTLGLQSDTDDIRYFNDKAVGGSLTMTSLYIGA